MFNNEGRRAVDKFPVSDRLTWSALRGIDRARKIKALDVVAFCAIGVIYGGGLWVVANWLMGA